MENYNIPQEYKPLSAWAYVGYNFLFSLPFVGFILLIVFSFSNENINRRNYARSFFCVWLLVVILLIILSVIMVASGLFFEQIPNLVES